MSTKRKLPDGLSLRGKTRDLPEGRKAMVALQEDDLIYFELTGGKDSIGGVISLEQLLAVVELVENLYDERAGRPRYAWEDDQS